MPQLAVEIAIGLVVVVAVIAVVAALAERWEPLRPRLLTAVGAIGSSIRECLT